MIDKDLLVEWVARLRSGRYVQGRSRLCNSQGQYCCLGVLCEIGVERGVLKRHGDLYFDDDGSSHMHYLPVTVFGVRDPEVRVDGELIPLSQCNDKRDYTFERIAELIETDYLTEDTP